MRMNLVCLSHILQAGQSHCTSSLDQIPRHFVEDAAVAVVLDFDGGVDAAGGDEVDRGAVGFGGHDLDGLEWLQVVVELDVEGLGAVEAQKFAVLSGAELERQDAHADEVRAVDPLERDGDDRSDAEQIRSFRGPVSGGACAVLGSREDDECGAVGLVLHRGVVDRHLFAGGEVLGDSAFRAGA